uniref:Uncharacterized protein n=1 Tax=Rhizophora mucronata TaxID=61149 RepID=A0A2P2QA83_RHIMU
MWNCFFSVSRLLRVDNLLQFSTVELISF